MNKISLDERLKNVGTSNLEFLSVFSLHTDEYFQSLSEIVESPRLVSTSEVNLCEHLQEDSFTWDLTRLVAELWYPQDDEESEEDAASLLYRVLIRPFALMDDKEREAEKR